MNYILSTLMPSLEILSLRMNLPKDNTAKEMYSV